MDQVRGYRGRGRHSDGQTGGRSVGNGGKCCQQWWPSSTSSTSTTRQVETDHVRGNGRRERSRESWNGKETNTVSGGASWRPIKVNNRPVDFDQHVTSPSEPDPVAQNLGNLRVSGIEAPTAPFATQGQILPVKRPSEVGKSAIKFSTLLVNHFPVRVSVVHNFGMEVKKRMTKVTGRVIGLPELKLGNADAASQSMKIEVEPPKFQRNFLLDFSEHDKFYWLDFERFKQNLLTRSRKMGINMTPRTEYKALPKKASTVLGISKGRLQLILSVTPKKDPDYKYLKWISEPQVGAVTQFCLAKTAKDRNDLYFANLYRDDLVNSNVLYLSGLSRPDDLLFCD